MSQDKGIGCTGAMLIGMALVLLLGLAGMGADYDSWCPPDHPSCAKEEK